VLVGEVQTSSWKKYRVPALLAGLGVIFLATCIPGIFKLQYLKNDYEAEKSNLEKWG
jgi:hypothetical protein